MPKVLEVFLFNRRAGGLKQNDDGRLSFSYDPAYVKAGGQALSLALPLTGVEYDHKTCHAVFGGMLPEGGVRGRLAKALGVSERNDFSLLAEIGGECAGAVSLRPLEPSKPRPASGRKPLSEGALEELFKRLPERPLLSGQGVRLSLAGAQNKLALTLDKERFFLPGKDEPSTHILKIAAPGYPGVLENELFCLRLASSLGLPAAKTHLGRAGSVAYLCVERFDRERAKDGVVRRLHQEDFCQALAIPSENKYQNEGGPDVAAGVRLLRDHAAKPATDMAAFLRLIFFNFLVGNSDAHAKNYSLLFPKDGPRLAPAYDLICTAVYPGLSPRLAMKIGSEYSPDRVSRRHWEALARACEFKPAFVLDGLRDLAGRMEDLVPAVIKDLEAEIGRRKVFGEVQGVIHERVDGLPSL